MKNILGMKRAQRTYAGKTKVMCSCATVDKLISHLSKWLCGMFQGSW